MGKLFYLIEKCFIPREVIHVKKESKHKHIYIHTYAVSYCILHVYFISRRNGFSLKEKNVSTRRKGKKECTTYIYILNFSLSLFDFSLSREKWIKAFSLIILHFCSKKSTCTWNCLRGEKGMKWITVYVFLTSPYEGRNEWKSFL
jgi:hypothetical protein